MDTRKRTFGWGDAVAVFVAAFVLMAVVYPAFVHTHRDNRTRGVVLDESRRPVAGAVVQIRSAEGQELARMTTDANGLFLWKRDWQKEGITFGDYGLTSYSHSSGGRDQVFMTRLAQHEARVINGRTGLEQADVPLAFAPTVAYPDRKWSERTTDEKGFAVLGAFPQSARMHFQSLNKEFAVLDVSHHVSTEHNLTLHPSVVRYQVTVVPTGTLTGRAVYPDGTLVTRGLVFASLVKKMSDGDSLYTRAAIDPMTKTFRMRGLLPGRWRIGFQPNYKSHDQSGGREVLVQSGETKSLSEPLRVYWTTDTQKP